MCRTILLVFVAAIAFSQVSASCRFFQDDNWWMYTAECTGVVVNNENDILDFSGQHEANRVNADVQRVVFRQSQLSTIPSSLFDVFTNVQIVEADNVGINRLNVGTLRNCNHLNELILPNNLISRLDNGVFKNCPSILRLNLFNNQLNHIGEIVFSDTPSINSLSLSNNRLVELPERVFQNAGSLRSISLFGNQISKISSNLFRGNPALTSISLDHNQLTNIPEGTFSDLFLASLSLSNNLISTIGRGAFARVGALSTGSGGLDLSHNRITRLSSEIFNGTPSNLVSFNIRNNGLIAIERNFFDFIHQSVTVFSSGNVCIDRDFQLSSRNAVNAGMEECFRNF